MYNKDKYRINIKTRLNQDRSDLAYLVLSNYSNIRCELATVNVILVPTAPFKVHNGSVFIVDVSMCTVWSRYTYACSMGQSWNSIKACCFQPHWPPSNEIPLKHAAFNPIGLMSLTDKWVNKWGHEGQLLNGQQIVRGQISLKWWLKTLKWPFTQYICSHSPHTFTFSLSHIVLSYFLFILQIAFTCPCFISLSRVWL